MKNINDEVMRAAEQVDEAGLKSFLLNPKCDALAKDSNGSTAFFLRSTS